jgi:ABC-type uncharacterized transport system involved in gliding motility auxiliary subunit
MSNDKQTLRHQRKAFDATALFILAAGFIALMVVTTFLFRGVRLDLTENNLYTLASGTKNILRQLDEPINLYFFFSQEPSREAPAVRAYAQRVRELLEEMAQRSDGKLRLNVIDPQPFSDEEDRATQFGLVAAPGGAGGESIYFGLAGTNSTDGKQTIPLFQGEREEFLEYDIVSMIYRLAHPKRTVVGLMSALPMNESFDQATGRMRDGWMLTSQLQELFDVKRVPTEATAIEPGIDVLMVVHPKNLEPATLYAIDQFVLRGGKLLAFMDPFSGQDPAGGGMPGMMGGESRASTLGPLLTAWGVEFDTNQVVGDRGFALTATVRAGEPPIRYIGAIALPRSNMNSKDVVTTNLDVINFMTAGSLRHAKDAKTQFEPLLRSSTDTMLMPASQFASVADPQRLLDGFVPGNESQTVAARITGRIATAFPTPPAGIDTGAQLKESAQDANVVLVADTDLLADMMWLRVQNVLGQRYAVPFANNGDLVTNILDNLTGSADLISIRGRQSFFRPFTRVDQLRMSADQQLRAKEQELNHELRDTEMKLQQLQAARQDQSSLSLTAEQQQELTRFQQERGRVRKELRDVRRSLDVGIQRLGWWVKALNIALIPFLLVVAAIILAVRRSARLRDSRVSVSKSLRGPKSEGAAA